MSLTHADTPISQQDLQDFYHKLLPYMGGSGYTLPTATSSVLGGVKIGENIDITDGVINPIFPVAVNQFNKSDLYSTTEKVIGCWTDGKPIYQKTALILGGLPNKSNVSYDMGTRNVDTVVDIKGNYNRSTYGGVIINAGEKSNATDYTIRAYYDKSNDRILIFTGYDGSGDVGYITMCYTKTTDSANSFKYADENDYSTTEHIIGTWVNSKPLYQKTISCGAFPNNTAKTVNHSISNIDRIVEIKGYGYNPSMPLFCPIPFTHTDANTQLMVYADRTAISLVTEYDLSAVSESYVTLKYTKTTD